MDSDSDFSTIQSTKIYCKEILKRSNDRRFRLEYCTSNWYLRVIWLHRRCWSTPFEISLNSLRLGGGRRFGFLLNSMMSNSWLKPKLSVLQSVGGYRASSPIPVIERGSRENFQKPKALAHNLSSQKNREENPTTNSFWFLDTFPPVPSDTLPTTSRLVLEASIKIASQHT